MLGNRRLPAAQPESSAHNLLACTTAAGDSALDENSSATSILADGTSEGAERSESTAAFDLTRSEPSLKYDRKLLVGTLAAGLLLATLVGVIGLVACTAMPPASVAFLSGIAVGQPDYMYSSLVPAYCPGSEAFAEVPWSHPITFFIMLLSFMCYMLALFDAGLLYAVVDMARLSWRASCWVRPAAYWLCQKFRTLLFWFL